MRHIRTTAWSAVTTAALLTATGCGGGTPARDDAADPGRGASAGASEDAGPSEDAGAGSADAVAAALTRTSDKASELGSAEIESTTVIAGSAPITMDGTYSWGDGAALDVEMDTSSAQMQSLQDDPTLNMRMVDGAYYYEVDPQPSGPLKGKKWMRIEVSAVAGEAGANSIADNADPTAGVRYLGTSSDVKDLGKATVRGKETTHYRGSIGAAEVNASKMTPQEKRAAVEALKQSGGRMTVDIWVDGDDLPVRSKQSGAGLTTTMDFVSFGDTEPITAPPAAETGDLTEQVREQRDDVLGQ
ncbi:hypothetical protein [Streptomyces sp. NPDC060194]|uniref:hypothetical protein n=1 Tax=Streptomyces sp. NPDC060194 TaxID=3347069 RepID=UPI00364FF0E5